MGRVRNGSDVGRVRNEEHLRELCQLLSDPNASTRQLNILYAIRSSWAARGYLLERELLIVRTNSQGEYVSKAEQRAAQQKKLNGRLEEMVARGIPVEGTQTLSDGRNEKLEETLIQSKGEVLREHAGHREVGGEATPSTLPLQQVQSRRGGVK